MSSLIKRIGRASSDPNDNLGGHYFESALELYLNGHVPKSRVVSEFNLTAQQENQLSWFKDYFDGLGTAVAKLAYFHDVIACVTLLQSGRMTEAEFRNVLGLPLASTTTTTSSTSTTTTTTAP